MNIKYKAASVALIAGMALSALPAFVSAQTVTASSSPTVSQLQAQLQTLLAQIASLHEQILKAGGASSTMQMHEDHAGGTPDDAMPMMMPPNGSSTMMMGSSSMPGGPRGGFCLTIPRNLSIGSQGSDVTNLQNTLSQDPTIYQGSSTGYFGPVTAKAMIKFQEKYGIASSTASSTGAVGPITRKFFENQCGHMPMPMMNASGTMMEGSSSMMGGPMMHPPMMTSSTASGSPMLPPPPRR